MCRRLPLLFVLVLSLLVFREASALTITNLDTLSLGSPLLGPDDFPFSDLGELRNKVYLVGSDYYYVHKVSPEVDSNEFITQFHTGFPVGGFTGVAGWSFSDADDAGGNGSAGDFNLQHLLGQLFWNPTFVWQNDPIKVFFVSTNPPTIGDYVIKNNFAQTDIAESYAPTPEPGSMMLLGSGLAALYGAARRRRNQKSASTPQVV